MICAGAGAILGQALRKIIEEADAFCGAALPREVGIGAVCEGRVVGVCARGVEAVDRLEG